MHHIQPAPIGQGFKQRLLGRLRLIPVALCGIVLSQREEGVGRHIREDLRACIRPDHPKRVDHLSSTQAKVQRVIHRGLKAARGHLLQQLPLPVVVHFYPRPNAAGVGRRAFQRHLQEVMPIALAGVVAINARGFVDVVDDQVQRAVVVQVHVRGAVGKPGIGQPPLLRAVGEGEIAVVLVGIVRDPNLRHLLQQVEVFLRDAPLQRRLNGLVGDVADVVEVVGPAVDPVADKEILVAAVVEVGKQGAPAPVRGVDAGQIPDIAKAPAPPVQLKGVASKLRMVPKAPLEAVRVVPFGHHRRLEDVLPLGLHVQRRQVHKAIIVDVGCIHAHREVGGVAHRLANNFRERAVAVVAVEKVVLVKVVAHVDVEAAVAIDVTHGQAQAIARRSAVDAGLLAHVGKGTAVVAKEAVARLGMAVLPLPDAAEAVLRMDGVVEQVHVEVAVPREIKERGLRGIPFMRKPKLRGSVREGAIAIVDIEDVSAVEVQMVDGRDVEVEVAVPIHIGHRSAAGPPRRPFHSGPLGDILELVVTFVFV